MNIKSTFSISCWLSIISISRCQDANMVAPMKTSKKSFIGEETVMNFTANLNYKIKHCHIGFSRKNCTASFKNGIFLKKNNCDKIFDDVILNRIDGKTCQVVIENTQVKHAGLWKYALQRSSEDFFQRGEILLEVEVSSNFPYLQSFSAKEQEKISLYSTFAQSNYPKKEVLEGSKFNLLCRSTIIGNYSCNLKRANLEGCIYTEASYLNWHRFSTLQCSDDLSGRVAFLGNIQHGICNFVVFGAKPIDKGFWGCEMKRIQNLTNSQSVMEWTDVRMIFHYNTSYFVTEGDSITLACHMKLLRYCKFSHEDEECCIPSYKDKWMNPKTCHCDNPNLNIEYDPVQETCKLEIKNVSLEYSGLWLCNFLRGYQKGVKITLHVTPRNQIFASSGITSLDVKKKVLKKGTKTIMHCNSTEKIEFCTISHGSKSCTAIAKDTKFVKRPNCDKKFDDVAFNRVNHGRACQIVIENTKLDQSGLWICSLRHFLADDKVFEEEVSDYNDQEPLPTKINLTELDKIWIITSACIVVLIMGSVSFACLTCFSNPRNK